MCVRFVFRIIKDPLFVALDVDSKPCIDQCFGVLGRESGATLELFLFTAKPDMLGHWCE